MCAVACVGDTKDMKYERGGDRCVLVRIHLPNAVHMMCTNRPPNNVVRWYDEVGFGPIFIGTTPAPVLRR